MASGSSVICKRFQAPERRSGPIKDADAIFGHLSSLGYPSLWCGTCISSISRSCHTEPSVTRGRT